jgi:hypothetical protein
MDPENQGQAILDHERTVAEILRIRSQGHRSPRWWETAAVLSSITAVLTVAVTSAASYFSQRAIRLQEHTLAQSDTRARQARDAITQSYDLVSQVLRTADTRLRVARGEYDQLAEGQLRSLIEESNRLEIRWQQEREPTEMLVFLYFGSGSDVQQQWSALRGAVQSLIDCADRIYLAHQADRAAAASCSTEQRTATTALVATRDAMVGAYKRFLPPSTSAEVP